MITLVIGAHSAVSIEVDGASDNKDERAMEVTADTDAADDPLFRARILRGSYVRFGRSLPSQDRELGDRNDEDKRSSSDEQQKRSKHYVRFGRSSPIDIDEYFYDSDPDNNNNDDDDDALQSFDFIARRSPRRHYVRFGRNGAKDAASAVAKRPNRHYVRFGRDEAHQQNGGAEKRAHYVRFGRGGKLGLREEIEDGDNDRASKADKRPNYVRFG